MDEHRKYTAFCGLYCKDCIPSNKELFRTIEQLERILTELKFDYFAAHKVKRSKVFTEYKTFFEVLQEIKKVECIFPCYEGPCSELGCSHECNIRQCVEKRGLPGCWDCTNCLDCEMLKPLKEFHPGLEHNLQMIKQHGIDGWIEKRGKHYRW